jgi:hypothetical protein
VLEDQLQRAHGPQIHLAAREPSTPLFGFRQIGPNALDRAGQLTLDTQRVWFDHLPVIIHRISS